MAWTYLIVAGLFEIVGVVGIKQTSTNDNWTNNLLLYGGFITSFYFLSTAMQVIPLSTAYAVWTGIGTLGSAVVGILFFKESRHVLRLFCIAGILMIVVTLKIIS